MTNISKCEIQIALSTISVVISLVFLSPIVGAQASLGEEGLSHLIGAKSLSHRYRDLLLEGVQGVKLGTASFMICAYEKYIDHIGIRASLEQQEDIQKLSEKLSNWKEIDDLCTKLLTTVSRSQLLGFLQTAHRSMTEATEPTERYAGLMSFCAIEQYLRLDSFRKEPGELPQMQKLEQEAHKLCM